MLIKLESTLKLKAKVNKCTLIALGSFHFFLSSPYSVKHCCSRMMICLNKQFIVAIISLSYQKYQENSDLRER